MATADPNTATPLTGKDRQVLDAWLEEFEQSWGEDRLADRLRNLPLRGHPLRLPTLVGLVKIDLRQRWQRGQRKSVASYVQEYPELASAANLLAELSALESELSRWASLPPSAPSCPAPSPELRLDPHRADATHAGTASSPATVDTERHQDSAAPLAERPRLPGDLPDKFGRYQKIKRLGRGGMGSVYLMYDTHLERQVALKVPHFTENDDPEILQRFRREALAAASIEHPNLCPIYDVGEIDGIHYLTMAFIEGRPLSDVLKTGGPLPPHQAALLTRKLALALEEAHKRGIIHRDLKALNIMINQRGEPVIMDFGLARRSNSGDVRLTRTGAVLGTPAYMPPEQVQGNVRAMGPGCDIYSLGVILYEMLVGRVPFEGSPMAVVAQILTEDPPPPSRFLPGVDPQLEAVCLKAMARSVADRYASMADFADALSDYLRRYAQPTAAEVKLPDETAKTSGAQLSLPPAPQPVRPSPGSSPTWVQEPPRRRVLPWVAVGAAAVLIGLGAFLYPQFRDVFAPRGDNSLTTLEAARREVAVVSPAAPSATTAPTQGEQKTAPAAVATSEGESSRPEKAPAREETPEPKKVAATTRPAETKPVETKPVETKPVETRPAEPPAPPDPVGEIRKFLGHTDVVWSVAFRPDGRRFVSGSEDKTIRLWDPDSGQEVRRIEGHKSVVNCVAFTPDGRRIVSGSDDKTLRVWDADSGKELLKCEGHKGVIHSIAVSPDGRWALSGSYDNTVRLWDLASGKELHRFEGHTNDVYAVAFSPDGKHALSGGGGTQDGAPVDCIIRLWDVETGKELLQLRGHRDSVVSLAFSPDGGRALSGGFDRLIRLWDVKTGKELKRFEGHEGAVLGAVFTPDGRRVLSGSDDRTLRLWDVASGEEVHRFAGHTGCVKSLAVSPNGRRALSGGGGCDEPGQPNDWSIRLWGLPGPELPSAKKPDGDKK